MRPGGSDYAQRKAGAWIAVGRAPIELYGDDRAVAFEDLADEIAIIRTLGSELTCHEATLEEGAVASRHMSHR
jgi:hypothetical protein